MASRVTTLAEARAWRQALANAARRPGREVKAAAKDIGRYRRSSKYLASPQRRMDHLSREQNLRTLPLGVVQQRKLSNRVAVQDRHYKKMAGIRDSALKNSAIRAGMGITAVLATGYAIKKIRNFKHKALLKREAQYRGYEVYPQHHHAAVPEQRVNRMVYYKDNEIGGGAPRVNEARKPRELPKQITGFQRKRRRFRYSGIRSKLHPVTKKMNPTHAKKRFEAWFKKREEALQKKMMRQERTVQASPSRTLEYNRQRIGRGGVRIAGGALAGHVAGRLMSAGSPSRYVRKNVPRLGTALGAFAGAGINAVRNEKDHYHSLHRAVNAPKQETPIDLPASHYMQAGKKARTSNHKLRMSLMRGESRDEVISRLVESLLGA